MKGYTSSIYGSNMNRKQAESKIQGRPTKSYRFTGQVVNRIIEPDAGDSQQRLTQENELIHSMQCKAK